MVEPKCENPTRITLFFLSIRSASCLGFAFDFSSFGRITLSKVRLNMGVKVMLNAVIAIKRSEEVVDKIPN